MGNSASKAIPKAPQQTNTKQLSFDNKFGRQIMQNIKLKESPFAANQKQVTISSNLRKRMELDKQTEGTISWHNFPSIFTQEYDKMDANKIEDIKKYFSLPIKKSN
jgi:hypothetical protein